MLGKYHMIFNIGKCLMQYFEKFKTLWKYAQTYLIDHTYGDWYEEGLDKSPDRRTALKGHIWKGTYHHFRALSNCIQRLVPDTIAPAAPTNIKLNVANSTAVLQFSRLWLNSRKAEQRVPFMTVLSAMELTHVCRSLGRRAGTQSPLL